MVESAASGLALIATAETGVEDFFTESDPEGWLIPSNSVDALCDALIEAKSHRARTRALGLRAASKVANGFSVEDYGRRARVNVAKVLGAFGR
jgi:glycosyltransferase involved in cell wall biosynthesis